MTAIDPLLWRDAEDGRALRELRTVAASRGHHVTVTQEPDRWTVRVLNAESLLVARCELYDRLALNADACRDALTGVVR